VYNVRKKKGRRKDEAHGKSAGEDQFISKRDREEK
jgi:hypothetical protein